MGHDNIILLFHLSRCGGFTPTLIKVLQEPKIYKIGVNISPDVKHLEKDFECIPVGSCRGMVDLRHIAASFRMTDSPGSLANMTKFYLFHQLPKPPSIRLSNWDGPLTREQIIYASMDAYVSYQVYLMMMQRGVNHLKELHIQQNQAAAALTSNPTNPSHPPEPFSWDDTKTEQVLNALAFYKDPELTTSSSSESSPTLDQFLVLGDAQSGDRVEAMMAQRKSQPITIMMDTALAPVTKRVKKARKSKDDTDLTDITDQADGADEPKGTKKAKRPRKAKVLTAIEDIVIPKRTVLNVPDELLHEYLRKALHFVSTNLDPLDSFFTHLLTQYTHVHIPSTDIDPTESLKAPMVAYIAWSGSKGAMSWSDVAAIRNVKPSTAENYIFTCLENKNYAYEFDWFRMPDDVYRSVVYANIYYATIQVTHIHNTVY